MLTKTELALAYELRQEGCTWKRIAVGLGCNHLTLQSRISIAKKRGILKSKKGIESSPSIKA